MVIRREEDTLVEYFTGGILNIFACSSTTKSQSKLRRAPFDSACLKGVEITFHGVLIVVGSDTGDVEVVWAEF